MRNDQTLTELTEDYFTRHPDEIDDFLKECFEEYAQDGDRSVLLSQLCLIARVKGRPVIAGEIDTLDQELHKAWTVPDPLRLDRVNALMRAMGYQLIPQRVDQMA
ncbi:MAG: addiction module antidote protein [Prochlorotrichaceae cyanobacterium]